MTDIPEALLGAPLIANLGDEERDQLLAAASRRTVSKGQFLFHEGDPAEGLFVLAGGCMKLVRFTPQGKELLLHLVHPGQTFAEAALFGRRTYPASSVAVASSEVWVWPRPRLVQLLKGSPELALALVLSVSVWTRHLVGKLELLTQRRVEERLAVYLLGHVHGQPLPTGASVELTETKSLIAAQLGTAPEVLSRTFRQLEEDGVLSVSGNRVEILDGDRFAVLAEPIEV